jgi:hypothetical protein
MGFGGAEIHIAGKSLLPVVSCMGKDAAGLVGAGQAVVRAGLLVCLPCLGRHAQCGGMLGTCVGGASGGQEHFAEAVERSGLAGQITGVTAQVQGVPQAVGGLFVAALSQVTAVPAATTYCLPRVWIPPACTPPTPNHCRD